MARNQSNQHSKSDSPPAGRKHINKSYNVERPEFWEQELEMRDLEFQNPALKNLPYFQELRQNFRERSDREEREPRISVSKAISMVREPPVEIDPIKQIPTHLDATSRSFVESVLEEGPMRLRYVPDGKSKPIAWTPFVYLGERRSYARLVPSTARFGSMPAFDRQVITSKGVYVKRLWNYFILRYHPLITAVYLGKNKWAVINCETGELLYHGNPNENEILPVKYWYDPDYPRNGGEYAVAQKKAGRRLRRIANLGWKYPGTPEKPTQLLTTPFNAIPKSEESSKLKDILSRLPKFGAKRVNTRAKGQRFSLRKR